MGDPVRFQLSALHGRAPWGLRALHSGHIGDYVAWWTLGTGTLGVVCLLGLRA